MKSLLLLLATLLVPAHLAAAWSARYAVDCPERCDSAGCKSSLRCKRTVLDDCGCCRVCAAGPGETCYRTVSAMDGVKCGPGLRCQFYSEEDDFGDEFGICKEHDMASGDGNAVREELVKENARSPVMKWLNPR
ncbi:endothelial cell-specific molecule 1 isoform 2-T2 [Lycaon pictus]